MTGKLIELALTAKPDTMYVQGRNDITKIYIRLPPCSEYDTTGRKEK